MTYHTIIKNQIAELEEKLRKHRDDADKVAFELNRLRKIEFEESMRLEEDNKKLLLG